MATVLIPTPLRKFTNNSSRLNVSASHISGLLTELVLNYPDLKKHLLDPEGKIPSFINIFVNEEDIRSLQLEQTEINDNSIVSIIPAIAGGAY